MNPENLIQEIGVWYKWINHTSHSDGLKYVKYVKSKGFSEYQLYYSERIDVDGTYKKQTDVCSWDAELVKIDLSEIQKFLPDGHPDKYNQEFKVGDYVILENAGGWAYAPCNNGCLGLISEIGCYNPDIVENYICSISGEILNSKNENKGFKNIPVACYNGKWIARHATPREIQNYLCSKIQTGWNPEIQISQTKTHGIIWTEPTPTPMTNENWKHKMLLSIDDDELPMVNVIKIKTVKNLNID